jgi:hypothetical protein
MSDDAKIYELYVESKAADQESQKYVDSDGSVWLDQHMRLHRMDGPAIERNNGDKEWWLHGASYKDATTWAEATLKHQNKLHDDMSIEVFLRKVLVKNSADLL